MRRTRPTAVRALLAIGVLAFAVPAAAQPYDHLECYKIKDLAPKVKYHADLTPEQTQFLAQTGCEIKVPGKTLCVQAEKANVVPAPPLSVNGQDARNYICYNLKCPKLNITYGAEDQFGARNLTVKKPFQLCAPAREIGFPDPPTPTPCLPPATPTATPTVAPTCNDLIQNGGETDVDCGGPCPACVLGQGCAGGSDCQSGFCTGAVCTVCSPGQTQSCGTMLPGACSVGLRTCGPSGTYGSCVAPPGTSETCNGVDDNCNGVTDEGLGSTTCGVGVCQNTVPNCVGGSPQSCTPGTPSVEVCNGIDDNCNGSTDEGMLCPALANANNTCTGGGGCSFTCNPGFSDCNAINADGCEVNTQTDVNNCGACGSACLSGSTCVSGVCKQPNGASCSVNANCQSNSCVDTVCCNTVCNGVCQACLASQTGGTNGTCANILAGTDPGVECPGDCNGAGACF